MSLPIMAATEKLYMAIRREVNVEEERRNWKRRSITPRGSSPLSQKLSNERFVAGAPADVVEQERQKMADGDEVEEPGGESGGAGVMYANAYTYHGMRNSGHPPTFLK